MVIGAEWPRLRPFAAEFRIRIRFLMRYLGSEYGVNISLKFLTKLYMLYLQLSVGLKVCFAITLKTLDIYIIYTIFQQIKLMNIEGGI